MNDSNRPVQPLLPFTRPSIDEDTIAAVAEVLRSGWLASGPQVAQLEAELSAYLGGRPVRTETSATAAMVSSSMLGRVKGSSGCTGRFESFIWGCQERATSTTPSTMTPIPATRCTLGTSPSSHQARPMLMT